MPEQDRGDASLPESEVAGPKRQADASPAATGNSENDADVSDRSRAIQEFAKRLDWLVFGLTRKARPKEGER